MSTQFNLCETKSDVDCCHIVRGLLFSLLPKYSLSDEVFVYTVQIAHDIICAFDMESDGKPMSQFLQTVAHLLELNNWQFEHFYI